VYSVPISALSDSIPQCKELFRLPVELHAHRQQAHLPRPGDGALLFKPKTRIEPNSLSR